MPKYLVSPDYVPDASYMEWRFGTVKEVTPEILEAVEIVCEAVLTRYPSASKTVREFFNA